MKGSLVFSLFVGACFAATTTISFSTFDAAALAGMQLNGRAATLNPNSGNELFLTTAGYNQVGSAFLKSSIDLANSASFSTAFSFKMTQPGGMADDDGLGADGIVFIVNSVTNIVGGLGEGMGYSGVANSIGVEFDTWRNAEPDGNHVGIDINGNVNSVQALRYPTRMNDGQDRFVWIDYDGNSSTLEVRISEAETRPATPFLSRTFNLRAILQSDTVYVGFSAATGGAFQNHIIRGWTFTNDFQPITTPVVGPSTVCGNNIVETGEDCDGGSCCDSQCKFRPATTVCRNAANGCDVDDYCSGTSAICVDQLLHTAACDCPRLVSNGTEMEYFCSPTGFYQCLSGPFSALSSAITCPAGTVCGCPAGVACSCNLRQSPCVSTYPQICD